MKAARVRYLVLGVPVLGVAVGLMVAWRHNRILFGIALGFIGLCVVVILVARDGWRQTSPQNLTARGFLPDSLRGPSVMDPGLRREIAVLLPTAVSERVSGGRIGRPVGRWLPRWPCGRSHAMRDDLVGEYIGHTAPKTKAVLDRAMGGVLFIDEAYTLFRAEDSKDYGQECIDILMQVMENERDKLVVILAGYKDRMDKFFASNPGMSSRIAHHLDFAEYEIDELLAIGRMMATRSSYYLSEEAESAFRDYLLVRQAQPGFGNARTVRNDLESARLRHAYRLAADPDRRWGMDDLMRLEALDIVPDYTLPGGSA